MAERGRGIVSVGAAIVAGVLGFAGARPSKPPPPPPPVASDVAPKPGTPCAEVALPGGSRLPDRPGCTVSSARYGKDLAAVVWTMPLKTDEPIDAGVVVEDRGPPPGPPPRPGEKPAPAPAGTVKAERPFKDYWRVPRVDEMRDVTGDGVDDLILSDVGDSDETSGGTYFIFGRRKDGFGDLGAYPMIAPKWGAGSFSGTFLSSTRDIKGDWVFAKYRFERLGKTEKKVAPLKATASSAAAKYPASNAVDGHSNTAWAPGKEGATLTVTLPWKAAIARISFATGFDSIDDKLGDLFWLNNRIRGATIRFEDGTTKNMTVGSDARWVDYTPSTPYKSMKVEIHVDDVLPGLKWKDTCISEVEVYERVGS